jgi:agmatinase
MVVPGVSFADAHASIEDASYIIIGIPFDRTASFRSGARFAPNAIREASYNFETYLFEHDVDLLDIPIHDKGNMEEFGTVDEMVENVRSNISCLVSEGKIPIIIGGEHSITIPAVESYDGVGVISIDAHLDFRQEYLGGRNSHACVTRRIAEHVGLENVVVLGVRSMSSEEFLGDIPEYIDAFTIKEKGIEWAVKKALGMIHQEKIYLTLDIDGIDPSYAPGTGTPEPFGISDLDVKKCVGLLAHRLVGFDVVEVCPPYDNGNTAALAARLIREVIATTWRAGRV